MWHALKLLLPVIIPSWNFFDVIVPSPRIQFALLNTKEDSAVEWHEFRPRAEKLTLFEMLRRMLWNAKWNESLYLVSCAERLIDYPTRHSEEEIFKRLTAHGLAGEAQYIQFRLVFIRKENNELLEEICYQSDQRKIEKQSN